MSHSNGIIRNFTRCTSVQFERMRNDLGIAMPDALLDRLVLFYRDSLRRDPYIGELCFLDRLAACPKDPYAARIAGLSAEDAEIKKTLSALLKKRRSVSRGTERPLTLGELFCTAPTDLEPLQNLPMWLSYADPDLFGSDGLTAPDASFSLRLPGADSHAGKPQIGDLFVLLYPGDHFFPGYEAEANAFCASPDVCARMRGVTTIGRNGIFDAILTYLWGAHVDLCRLDRPIEDLLSADDAGLKLLLLPKSEAEAVVRMAKDAGFDPCIFTAVTQNGTFDIRLQTGEILSFPAGFLRGFRIPTELPDLTLLSEESTVQNQIAHLLGGRDDRIVTPDGSAVAVASCTAGSSPFSQAIATVYAAVLPQILSGATLDGCRLAVGVEIPRDQSAAELAVAVALGLYRAKEELGISTPNLSLQSSPTVSAPKLTVFSVSKSDRVSSHFTLAGSKIYVVSIQTETNGLPDFASFRAFAKNLSELIGSGRIQAVGIAVSEPIVEALCRMRTNDLQERLTDPGESVSLAAILVSSETLPFPCIGTVVASTETPES